MTRPAEETPQGQDQGGGEADEPSVFRVGGVTYLRIPTRDVGRSASFYKTVFGWRVKGPDNLGFSDATGHVIGHWQPDLPVAGEAGVIPYIFVDRVDDTLWQINEHGGEVVKPPYPEGDLWIATFRDPDGNVLVSRFGDA